MIPGKRLLYPKYESILELNEKIIEVFRERQIGENWRKDKHELRNPLKLREIISEIKSLKENIYHKAAVLLIRLVKNHVFASANRRTAFYVTAIFLMANNYEIKAQDDPSKSTVMLGIREENAYTKDEIARWLEEGTLELKKLRRES